MNIVADRSQKEIANYTFHIKLNKEEIVIMAKTMNELLDIINATDPDSGEEFLKLLQPEKFDRYEMGSILEATLGHDLTSYYDKKEIGDYLKFIESYELIDDEESEDSKQALDEIKDYIRDNREEIIKVCFDDFDSQRSIQTHAAVDNYFDEIFGCDISEIIGDADLEPDLDEDGNVRLVGVTPEDDEEPDEDYPDDDDD